MAKLCTYTFLTVLTVGILATAGDITVSWTSPILPKLHSPDPEVNPLGRPITADEESWIGSLINIGALIGPLPFGYLSERIGRKFTILCIAIPHIVSYTVLALVHHVYVYYAARLLGGVSLGAGCSLLSLYIAEIAEDSNRGMLSVTLNIFWTFGNLMPYILGPYMPVLWFNIALACIPAFFFVVFLLMAPESPYFLVGREEITKAEESLMKLRSRSRSAVEKEILSMQATVQQDEKGTFFDLFRSRANIKALVISLCLIIFQQLSGINIVIFYTQLIFQMSGSENIAPEISSIIIGLVLFSTSMIIPFFADRFGRRFFLMLSATLMMTGLLVLGGYFYMKENVLMDVSTFSWLPILTLVVFIVGFNLGYGILPWTIGAELFPVNVKPYGASMVSCGCWLTSFLVTKFFNNLNDVFGRAGTFWLYACFCFLAILFPWFFVPETKGKSFKEIRDILEK